MLPDWSRLDSRLSSLIERFGAAVCTNEPVFDGAAWVHITASARVWNPERTRVLKRWSAKQGKWQPPGAHGEGDFDLRSIARREAGRALGFPLDLDAQDGEAVEVRAEEIAEYWNTPAHLHLEVVFEWSAKEVELPRAAWWFEEEQEAGRGADAAS